MSATNKIAAGAALCLAAVAVTTSCGKKGWANWGKPTPGAIAESGYYTVKRGNFLVSITEAGALDSSSKKTLSSEMDGVTTIVSILPEGTPVKKDDVIVVLEAGDLKEKILTQEVTIQSTENDVNSAKEDVDIRKLTNDFNDRQAELLVELAKLNSEQYILGDFPTKVLKAQSDITLIQSKISRTKDRMFWTEKLEAKGYATKSELEADRLVYKENELSLKLAEETLRVLEKYEQVKEQRRLKSEIEKADLALIETKQTSKSRMRTSESLVITKVKTLELQREKLNDWQQQLKKSKIIAPQDGIVVYAVAQGGSGRSSTLIEKGAQLRQGQEIVQLPDVTRMMVEVEVHESNVRQVRAGLPASIKVDSLPDRVFRGTVKKVAPLPDTASRFFQPNRKVYKTEVTIDEQLPEDLRPGVSAKVQIFMASLTNVVTVPISTVTTVKGKQVCFVKDGEKPPKLVEVKVGHYDDKFIEITDGLLENSQVLLSPLQKGEDLNLTGAIPEDPSRNVTVPPAPKNGTSPLGTVGPSKGGGGGGGGFGKGGGDLSASLNLTTEQKQKWDVAMQEMQGSMATIFSNPDTSQEERREKMRGASESFQTKAKLFLTPEQLEKYQTLMNQSRKGGGGAGPGN
ncbi:MAG: HlyD family efflux transporter periplasmic adaptor subunit [Pedosphaera sp.]|nr:HlyD family efflux transporter periplasmic adaptor subunit [Pedosphaera sp.]